MMEDFELAKRMLIVDEGDRRSLYDCGTGHSVVADSGHITGGIGHNFDARPLSDEVVNLLFVEDWMNAIEACRAIFANYQKLPQARRLALLNMAFNMGQGKLSGFKRMIKAVHAEEFNVAADEAQSSYWFIQVKERGARVVRMLRDDVIPKEYFE